jgi:hypothetical protein
MRHDMLQFNLKQLGMHGGNNVIDSELGQMTENDGRKGDLLFNGMGKDGCGLVVDISIGTATAQSYLDRSAHISNYVLNKLEANKYTKYAAGYRNIGVDFTPLTFEMQGATSDLFDNLF